VNTIVPFPSGALLHDRKREFKERTNKKGIIIFFIPISP
jgi:hypothetical protein